MPESRSVTVRLTAETAQYIREMQKAGKVADDAMTQVEGSTGRATKGITALEGGARKTTLALVAGLGASAKAAVDWESAFTGVTKTVDATAGTSIPQLEKQLRDLAKTMPATHEEIAGVAEAAGQLGVGADDVTAFTETMVQLGETTNLSADEAATSLARFANIMGTSLDDVDRLGSSVVGLGNNFETTEAEIVALSTRLAAAGNQAGLTEADVFGIAAALSSVGVEAEAGGTAMSKVFTTIGDGVRSGGSDLDTFARIAGLTADQFVRMYENDPAAAIGGFVEGMGQLAAEGGNTTEVFQELGLTDSRLQRAVLSVGQATGSWADAVGLANDEYDKNNALTEEFGKRLGTTGAQVQKSFNNIKDAAIDVGSTLLPLIESAATGAADLANAFQELPDPIKSTAVGLAGITAAVGGGLWFTSKAIGSVTAMRTALMNVGLSAEGANRSLSAIGKGFVVLGVIEGINLIDGALDDLLNRRVEGSTLQRDLDALVRGEVVGNVEVFNDSLLDLESTFNRLVHYTLDSWIPVASGPFEKAEANIADLDTALAQLVETGDRDKAEAIFQAMLDEAEASGVAIGTLTSRLDQYFLALRNAGPEDIGEGWDKPFTELYGATTQAAGGLDQVEGAGRRAGAGAGAAAGGAEDLESAFERAMRVTQEWTDALERFNGVLSGRAGLRDYQAAVDQVAASVKENGRTLDENTEKGRNNQAALDAIAGSALKVAESLRGPKRANFLQGARQDFIESAQLLGLTQKQARALATELGLLDRKGAKPDVDLDTKDFDRGKDNVDRKNRDMDKARPTPRADLDRGLFNRGAAQVDQEVAALNRKRAEPTADLNWNPLRSAIGAVNSALNNIPDEDVFINVKTRRSNETGGFGAVRGLAAGGYPQPTDRHVPAPLLTEAVEEATA